MTLRRRVALASTVAVAIAVVVASIVVWFVVRGQLYSEVDHSLRAQSVRAVTVATRAGNVDFKKLSPAEMAKLRKFLGKKLELQPPGIGGSPTAAGLAVVTPNGKMQKTAVDAFRPVPFIGRGQSPKEMPGAVILADPTLAKAVAAGHAKPGFSDAIVQNTHLRLFTQKAASGEAVQVFRPMTEVDHTLGNLKWILVVISLGGTGLAALLGRAVSRNATRPVQRLTETAEHVTHTRDLSARIPADERDELGRLAASFNTMLAALESSQQAQRQLVADASHELRTPLTSLRTNLELLRDGAALPPDERQAMLARSVAQIEELSVLVGDLVDLARDEDGETGADEEHEARLDLIVAEEIGRAERHAPGRSFVCTLQPSLVRGAPDRVARAVRNLLDNALKWGPPEEPVEVTAIDGELHVRDHGPGIAADDLPFVFDRFYRAPDARGLPGSGLGLAIVRQVAETSGGQAWAEVAEGGGARLCLRLPVVGPVSELSPEPVAAAFLPSS